MTALFLDCDDTLVIWLDEGGQPLAGENPYGGGAQRWVANYRLLREVEMAYSSDPELRICVWSGGGLDYAKEWGQRLLPHVPHIAVAKDPSLPLAGDIVVDDAPDFRVACPVTPPDAFFAEKRGA